MSTLANALVLWLLPLAESRILVKSWLVEQLALEEEAGFTLSLCTLITFSGAYQHRSVFLFRRCSGRDALRTEGDGRERQLVAMRPPGGVPLRCRRLASPSRTAPPRRQYSTCFNMFTQTCHVSSVLLCWFSFISVTLLGHEQVQNTVFCWEQVLTVSFGPPVSL